MKVSAFRLLIFTVSVFVLCWNETVCVELRPRVGLLSVMWKKKRMCVDGSNTGQEETTYCDKKKPVMIKSNCAYYKFR
jgi:hypothetical protein